MTKEAQEYLKDNNIAFSDNYHLYFEDEDETVMGALAEDTIYFIKNEFEKQHSLIVENIALLKSWAVEYQKDF